MQGGIFSLQSSTGCTTCSCRSVRCCCCRRRHKCRRLSMAEFSCCLVIPPQPARPASSACSISSWGLALHTDSSSLRWSVHTWDEVQSALPKPLPLLSCCVLGWVSDAVNQLSLSNAAGLGFGAGVTPARLCSGSASTRHSPPRCVPRTKRLVETRVQTELAASTGCVQEEVIPAFSPQCVLTQPLFSFPCCFP